MKSLFNLLNQSPFLILFSKLFLMKASTLTTVIGSLERYFFAFDELIGNS
jgi:hypothetical protein